jgi:hypothetical protein
MADLDPTIIEYLKNKYPEKFGQLAQEKATALSGFDAQNESPGIGKRLLMGLTAAMQKDKSYEDVAGAVDKRRATERARISQPYDEQQKDLAAELGLDKSATEFGQGNVKFGQEQDAYREGKTGTGLSDTISKLYPQFSPIVAGKSDDEVRKRLPLITSKIDQNFKASQLDKTLSVKKDLLREKPTKGQDQADKKFGEEYNDFILKGGYGIVQNQLASLQDAINDLETDKSISGPIRGRFPDAIRSLTNPKAVNVKEQIAAVVQNSLRPILGAQFTEKEGENLIKRTYNDSLSPEINAKRARRLLSQIKTMADQKKEAADYFEEHGTLRGYKGGRPSIANIELPEEEKKAITEEDIDDMSEEELRANGLL